MSQGLKEVHQSDVAAELENQLIGQFKQMLGQRGPGHCMRVSDLDAELMRRLGLHLHADVPDALVHVLTSESSGDSGDLYITSTKLIELYGDYWHRGQDPQDRIDLFKDAGYECLVIWEHELNESPDTVRSMIANFGGRT